MPEESSEASDAAIAIVGIAGLFPGAATLEQFWHNICHGVDSTTSVPEGRWLIDPAEAFDARITQVDRVYSTRGGFVSSELFDPGDSKVDGIPISTLDPVFQLALHVARTAWASAMTDRIDGSRVGVILGNIVLPVQKLSAWSRDVLATAFEEKLGLSAQDPGPIEPANVFPAGLPAAFIARALGLKGPAFTLDAACATSLYSISLAVDELKSGRADAILCGGVSRPDALYIQMGFSQLRALSPSGRPAPLDRRADGLVAGEGAGMFVLKRLTDALEHGDHIYALVAAAGLSNDYRGDLLAPSSEGQLRAMRRAYEKASWSPRDVDLIECHATGAPVGDRVELESLKSLWGEGSWRTGQCVLGSVKSNIGHALTAAGAAGVLKVLLSLKHRMFPPTANFESPAPQLGLEGTPFRVLSRSEPWPERSPGSPRRAAISGFGFGGINAHVLIEEWLGSPQPRTGNPRVAKASAPIAIVGIASQFGSIKGSPSFLQHIVHGDRDSVAEPPSGWWAIPETRWFRAHATSKQQSHGLFIDELEFPVGKFRIPPRELGEMLPQQSLMLKVAAEAVKDARWNEQLALSTCVLIGIGLDMSTTNYHLRWSLAAQARHWNESLALGLAPDELESWIDELKGFAGPALSANRTIGSLGGMVASRVARELRIGGPSFTLSCDETSGMQALSIAARWLESGELDAAIVGAVDLAGDLRSVLARRDLAARSRGVNEHTGTPCDGAVALVLKRVDDARRDGDRIYALLRSADGGWINGDDSPSTGRVHYIDLQRPCALWLDDEQDVLAALKKSIHRGSNHSFALGSLEGDLGTVGAASGLAAVAKAALCLNAQVIPGLRHRPDYLDPSVVAPSAAYLPEGSQFWMRNRKEGTRRAAVVASNLGGNCQCAILEEFDTDEAAESSAHIRFQSPERRLGLFAIRAGSRAALIEQIKRLASLASSDGPRGIDQLARKWWQTSQHESTLVHGIAVIADGAESLRHLLDEALERGLETSESDSHAPGDPNRIYLTAAIPSGPKPLSLVYPGLGNQFAGMGRELSLLWPEVLRSIDAENELLRDQLDPRVWWAGDAPRAFDNHLLPILGSVSLGCFVTDVLRGLGVTPQAAIGYSLGETTALLALRAWARRDEMLLRLKSSPLFQTELSGPCAAARRVWELPANEAVNWVAGIVPCSVEHAREAIGGNKRVEILIKNTATESVIGGARRAVQEVVRALNCSFFELSTVSTVHCSIGRSVEREYLALHDLETSSPEGIAFYSGVWGRRYAVDRRSAAAAIAAQASAMIDFPALVERAYEDGVRVFVEVGPGSSCTRLIGQILHGRPHVACSACRADSDPLLTIMDVAARLIVEGVPVNLAGLYGREASAERSLPQNSSARPTVRVAVRGSGFNVPAIPARVESAVTAALPFAHAEDLSLGSDWSERSEVLRSMLAAEHATAEAHRTFLSVSAESSALIAQHVALELDLIEHCSRAEYLRTVQIQHSAPPPVLDRRTCLEFAVGRIARALGPEYAPVDAYPTRVRLPDEPLMLVDRVLLIEGTPRSMQGGRIVTEHDVRHQGWYCDAGRIVPSIAIEAGQADLLLCAYLGVDFETRGQAVYRLLDATVTYHRALPREGDVVRYDIRIDEFFRQGQTILFRFRLEATVSGEPFLSMRDGCAGFFTAEELASGRGIIPHAINFSSRSTGNGAALDLIPPLALSLEDGALEALRHGDLAGAFGPPFDRLALKKPLLPPGGRLKLLHRVTSLETTGGAARLGFVRAEADIHFDDWFLVCHFVDDRVMPGTLMYQSCLDALRILMFGMGMIGRSGEDAFEPIVGAHIRLKCRGQVVESSKHVSYEVTIKERGYRPEPYAIADAMVLVEGKPIVELSGISLQLSGSSRQTLEALWGNPAKVDDRRSPRVPAFFEHHRILAFALGRPVEAFGERYRPFENGRFLARLPAPPFACLHRIMSTDAQPWVMTPGKSALAEFDIDPNAWFFEADRQDSVPLAILLEIALQPCGWLAAYMGSALRSTEDLHFRNLGGTARLHRPVTRRSGTLKTQVKATKITSAVGMILQSYEFSITSAHGLVYDGSADFGFFPPKAMHDQVGIRDAAVYQMNEDERSRAESPAFPNRHPFPDSRWLMVDQVEEMLADGGSHGLGLIRGSSQVDPAAWFFAAHFMNDPVWPGSLGLESMIQLLKLMAALRWGATERTAFESPLIGLNHRWIYRGQIVPTDHRVTVQAVIKTRDDRQRRLVADGHLEVDGKIIYQMHDFAIGLSAG